MSKHKEFDLIAKRTIWVWGWVQGQLAVYGLYNEEDVGVVISGFMPPEEFVKIVKAEEDGRIDFRGFKGERWSRCSMRE